jgi:Mycothiol maleylpyruvate isomerase N-terminal domain
MAAADALGASYGAITAVVEALDPTDFARATGCAAWTVDALLFHVMLDAQRALMALAAPGAGAADTDRVSYWRKYAEASEGSGTGADEHAIFVTRSAAAYADPHGLVRHWSGLSSAAVSAARRADPVATVSTQGHCLLVEDFLDTLVVEATIHHLDLVADLPGAQRPPAGALASTRQTLETLLEREVPVGWGDVDVVLRLTGRTELSPPDLDALGDAADRVPVIG